MAFVGADHGGKAVEVHHMTLEPRFRGLRSCDLHGKLLRAATLKPSEHHPASPSANQNGPVPHPNAPHGTLRLSLHFLAFPKVS